MAHHVGMGGGFMAPQAGDSATRNSRQLNVRGFHKSSAGVGWEVDGAATSWRETKIGGGMRRKEKSLTRQAPSREVS
jgi:hypothetical protein